MKKIFKSLFFVFTFLLFTNNVGAESIKGIYMDIHIDNNGDAYVTETWKAHPTEKTEYYHAYHNLGESSIEILEVSDETTKYELKDWDIDESLDEKAYKYGYNYTDGGVEICFGKSSYKEHTYVVKYKITSFVSTVEDADIIYFNLLDSINPAPGQVQIIISADEPFADTLPVWGYGSLGNETSVSDGKIYITNLNTVKTSDYFVLLAQFDKGTFNTTNILEGDFKKYHNMAEEGATHYNDNSSFFDVLLGLFAVFFNLFIWIVIIFGIVKSSASNGLKSGSKVMDYGTTGKKLPKDVNLFRELPCGKDLYRAYWLAYNYGLMKKQTDFLGAILLKWVKQGKITIDSKTVGGLFKKEDTTLLFKESIELDTELEKVLYQYMYEASKDGILESKEFERWCKNHYTKILAWFDKILDEENDKLINEGKLVAKEKVTMKIFKSTVYEVNPSMYEEAIKMKGLKQFFNEFENMKDKEAIEVNLWEEYLMYAQLFGVADKVAKQFKEIYPDVINEETYNSMIFVHTISHTGMVSASSAKSRAESYSSGGGGFSSGGGGGGSFGGGGGGSR